MAKKTGDCCSFCGRDRQGAGLLISGIVPNCYICEECVQQAYQIVTEKQGKQQSCR